MGGNMEQQLENVIGEKTNELKKVNSYALIYPVLLTVFALTLLVGGYFLYRSINNEKYLESKISKLESKFGSVENKLIDIDIRTKPKEGEVDMKTRIDSLDRDMYFSNMQHNMEHGVITDDFVVEKISIFALPAFKEKTKGILTITADLSAQPTLTSHYTGSGGFDLADRDLKAKLSDLVKKIKDGYQGSEEYIKGIPKFDEDIVLLSVKNYEIAKYQEGKIKLKGEY
jgi:hypothetical protein